MDFVPVPTRASLLLNKEKANDFKAIVFEEQKPGSNQAESHSKSDSQPKRRDSSTKRSSKEDNELEFDIKKARHEVLRFAMNNQRVSKNKKRMEVFQAIKLGAKPTKKANKNYKELQAERKRLKDIREQRRKLHQLGKNQAGAASVKCRSKTKTEKLKKKRAPVSAIDQHYGKVRPKLK